MLRVGIVGLGGWATRHHRAFVELESEGEARVVATCDPRWTDLLDLGTELGLEKRGVLVCADFEAMMLARGGEIDLMIVAAPIHLHARMHAACVEAGIPCYLEKPPTLDLEELAAMIQTEERACKHTYVAFNFVYEEARRKLKQRMVDGEFGRLKQVSFIGLTRRSEKYFTRNSWAGRLVLGGNLLLDSCIGNAMAHFLNGVLFMAGNASLNEWATLDELEVELYRVNEIEGMDTVFAKGKLEGGVALLLAASHACKEVGVSEEAYEFEKGTISIRGGKEVEIFLKGGVIESMTIPSISLLDNLRHYISYLRGELDRPAILLADCRGFVDANALLYVSAVEIHSLSSGAFDRLFVGQEDAYARVISGIEDVASNFAATGNLPSRQAVPWGRQGGKAQAAQVRNLRESVTRMVAASIKSD